MTKKASFMLKLGELKAREDVLTQKIKAMRVEIDQLNADIEALIKVKPNSSFSIVSELNRILGQLDEG